MLYRNVQLELAPPLANVLLNRPDRPPRFNQP